MAGPHDHGHHHHPHSHGHGHSHAHDHGPVTHDRAFAIGLVLNLGFVLVEGGYGFFSDSLALVADAGHNLGDVAGLVLAWAAAWLGRRPPTRRRTYGFGRASILAALANATLLLVAVGAIGWEAIRRLAAPEAVANPLTVAMIAAAGIVINGATALMFLRGRGEDANIRGVFLHMAGDAAVSAGVAAAAVAIAFTGAHWIDPAVSLAVVAVIGLSAWGLLRDSFSMAMDEAPEGIDPHAVEAYLSGVEGVTGVHDLHIWPISTTATALTAHLVRSEAAVDDQLTAKISGELKARFAIAHATLQFETGDGPCALEPDHVV